MKGQCVVSSMAEVVGGKVYSDVARYLIGIRRSMLNSPAKSTTTSFLKTTFKLSILVGWLECRCWIQR